MKQTGLVGCQHLQGFLQGHHELQFYKSAWYHGQLSSCHNDWQKHPADSSITYMSEIEVLMFNLFSSCLSPLSQAPSLRVVRHAVCDMAFWWERHQSDYCKQTIHSYAQSLTHVLYGCKIVEKRVELLSTTTTLPLSFVFFQTLMEVILSNVLWKLFFRMTHERRFRVPLMQ